MRRILLAVLALAVLGLVAWSLPVPAGADPMTLSFAGLALGLTVQELREKRAKLYHDAQALDEKAKAEKRDLTAEEAQQFDAMTSEADKLEKDISRQETLERHRAAVEGSQGRRTEPDQPGGEHRDVHPAVAALRARCDTPEYRAFSAQFGAEPYGRAFRAWCRGGAAEVRALQADIDVSGGYMVPPEQFVAQLLQAVDNQTFIRQLATVIPSVTAQSLGIPSLDTDPSVPTWTSEIAAPSEDSSMALGKRELTPHPLSKLIKVSNKLLRTSAIPAEELVRERLAYIFGITEENGFINGPGAGAPLGLMVASAQGISTGRDVSTDNTATALTADGLINAKFFLKGQYWPRATWLFHRDAVKMICKLKDGNGQYIWRPGLISGQPDMLLDLPYRMSEYMPHTFTTTLYVGLLGDLKFYWIADALTMSIQRLAELYAATNQVGFIGRLECDGMPVLEEAFVRVKLG